MKDAPWETARELVAEIELVLGEGQVVGAYIYGSLVHDAFVDGQSDIDLLVLLDSELSPGEIERLQVMHSRFVEARPAWDDRVEVQYAPAAAMWNFKTVAIPAAIVSPGEPFHPATLHADWLQNWFDVREFGVALRGSAASTFIGPISNEEFVAAIRVYVAELRDRLDRSLLHRGSLAYVVLSLCRARHTCLTGEQVSKQDAVELARVSIPGWSELFDWAMAIRLGTRGQQNAPVSTREHERVVRFVQEQASLLLTSPIL